MSTTPGGSGLALGPIALGTWQLSGHWGSFDEDEAVTAIRHARELGVTTFDTAHAYGWGRAERVLGRALEDDLRHHREDVVIVTKGGLRISEQGAPYPDSSRSWLREGIESSLRSLGVDRLDLYLLHASDPDTPIEDTAEFLRGYVDRGVIRHVGVSNFDAERTAALGALLPVVAVEPPYSLFRPEAEDDLLPYADRAGLAVLAYSPLASGLLSGALRADTPFAADDWRSHAPMFQGEPYRRVLAAVSRLDALAREEFGVSAARLAIAWALTHPAVDTVIVGTRRAKHLQDAVAAAGLRLGPGERRAVERAVMPPDSAG
ncbi:MAG: aldo/keto reductase [Catenulispora sp.]